MLRKTIFGVLFTVMAASGLNAAPAPEDTSKALASRLTSPTPQAEATLPGRTTTQLVYQVKHSTYGALGTYINTIQKNGNTTDVKTEAHLKVGALGFSVYRQDIARQERWNGNRLIYFHGVTTVNGKTVELNGKAEGDSFMLMTPDGEVVAPADVRIANPWSKEAVVGDKMLTPDRGRLEQVTVTGDEETSIPIRGRPLRVHHYQVQRGEGPRRYDIWLDEEDRPVQFAVVGPNDTVTFTLTS